MARPPRKRQSHHGQYPGTVRTEAAEVELEMDDDQGADPEFAASQTPEVSLAPDVNDAHQEGWSYNSSSDDVEWTVRNRSKSTKDQKIRSFTNSSSESERTLHRSRGSSYREIPQATLATFEHSDPDDYKHFEIHDQVDPSIHSIFAYGYGKNVVRSDFKYRWALLPRPEVFNLKVDRNDGFDVYLKLNSGQTSKIQDELAYRIVDILGDRKLLDAMVRGDFYICAVQSNLLSTFEIIYNAYGIEYPLARKLALEFHKRAQAVASSNAILFRDRSDKSQTASAFLKLHYGSRLDLDAKRSGNELYQNELRKIDPSLMKGLDNEFDGRRDELLALIAKKRDEVNARLGPGAEQMSPAERKATLDRILHLGKK